MSLSFEKYHGLGNDFLVVEVDSVGQFSIERAMRLCDRHFGVGGDGVLLISPAPRAQVRARMTVINADGSTPEMCGNGLRCVALHLCRKNRESAASFLVATDAGELLCEVTREGDSASVGTAIGKGTHLGTLSHRWEATELRFARVSTGNPHAVCFHEPLSAAALDELGKAVSARIEGGANVEIATLRSPTEIDLSVWERGVGRTLACGTGAAATAIEAVRSGRSPAETPLTVRLPGGELSLTVSRELDAHLRGPAEWVYSGQTHL